MNLVKAPNQPKRSHPGHSNFLVFRPETTQRTWPGQKTLEYENGIISGRVLALNLLHQNQSLKQNFFEEFLNTFNTYISIFLLLKQHIYHR